MLGIFYLQKPQQLQAFTKNFQIIFMKSGLFKNSMIFRNIDQYEMEEREKHLDELLDELLKRIWELKKKAMIHLTNKTPNGKE